MKNIRKYRYLVLLLFLLIMIVLIISPKDKRPSTSAAITESGANAVNENSSYLPESDTLEGEAIYASATCPEEETVSIARETPEEETAPAISEAPEETESVSLEPERPHAIEGIPGYKYVDVFPEDIVFASDESVKFVSDLYDKIGFEGKFQSGDETVYEFYRQKFALF